MNPADMDKQFDVAIVGAGMVGASLGIGLQQMGLKIALVDAASLSLGSPEFSRSFDARSTALSGGSAEIFRSLGVWDPIAEHANPISKVHVSEKQRFGLTEIDQSEVDQDHLGFVVQNKWLGECLLSRLQAENVDVFPKTKVSKLMPTVSGYRIEYSGHQKEVSGVLNAKLCVIADGAGSATARSLGIDYQETDYHQHAIIANVETEQNNLGVAYERFTASGPLAMLPLSSNLSSLVWTLPESDAEGWMNASEEEFANGLNQRFGERLGTIKKIGTRAHYPLRLIESKEQIRPGLVVVGNAAHSLHPVAGQGFNLALRGIATLLEQLEAYAWELSPAEAFASLKEYEHIQRLDQKKTIAFSDQVINIFGSDSLLLSVAREAGLVGLNAVPEIKKLFTSHAMGVGGRRARLKNRVAAG